ncbi:unnamed protein product [Kuraishia capsulata CBS 1993]|uniref:Uncharacterized protein n=1 Tax=Kuraishia capsulata CBS 1993 TaxID=1382522 RepID=W6MTT9_9ASCO|nr:uncharacterized protein KUCA_T00001207001 [Kuraishia capsulata CBS 1993]CDK25240.1 unnamed protein product [Kuraishia capsulata CBS 1993]
MHSEGSLPIGRGFSAAHARGFLVLVLQFFSLGCGRPPIFLEPPGTNFHFHVLLSNHAQLPHSSLSFPAVIYCVCHFPSRLGIPDKLHGTARVNVFLSKTPGLCLPMSEPERHAFAYQLLDVEKATKALSRSQQQSYQYKNMRWRNNFQYQQPQPYQPQHTQQTQQQHQQQLQGLQSQQPPLSQPVLHQHLSQPQIHTLAQHAPQTYYSDSYLTRQRSYQHEQPDTPKSMASVPDSKINDLKLFDPFENSSMRALTPTSTSGSLLSSLDQTNSPAFAPTVPQGQTQLPQQPQKTQIQLQNQPNLLRSVSLSSQYQSGSQQYLNNQLPGQMSTSQFNAMGTTKSGSGIQTNSEMSSRLWGLSSGLNSQFGNSSLLSTSSSQELNFGSSLLSGGKSVSNWSNVW